MSNHYGSNHWAANHWQSNHFAGAHVVEPPEPPVAPPVHRGGLARNWRELLRKALEKKAEKKKQQRVIRRVRASGVSILARVSSVADARVIHVRSSAGASVLAGQFSRARALRRIRSGGTAAIGTGAMTSVGDVRVTLDSQGIRNLVTKAVADQRDELMSFAMSDQDLF